MSEEIRAVILVCSLKSSNESSSSEKLATDLVSELNKSEVVSEVVRVADHNIASGVKTDMGDGDDWPKIREKILSSQILIIATPIWLGHPSSNTQKILERLDAELSEENEDGMPSMYGKVAGVAVVGNEDGAHKVCADVMQGLIDVGFSVPAAGCTYWVGEAMGSVDYKDLKEIPKKTSETTAQMAKNLNHLARLLKDNKYS